MPYEVLAVTEGQTPQATADELADAYETAVRKGGHIVAGYIVECAQPKVSPKIDSYEAASPAVTTRHLFLVCELPE